ncbi:iron transporter [Acinetobacter haemolyticus]|uniref:iron transporter n=1 Tax=Acinetobacter haemolyticus TaxID=29430 RepID=UPI0021CF91B5|nr:iron transporter [Acinetobacter haemolyticus]MCU4386571.1 iron transporter [Acinetobacter haemolyticus]
MTIEASVPFVATKTISKKTIQRSALIKYRLMVLSRFVLAIFGGYYFSAITAMLIVFLFPTEPLKANAVLSVTMLAFIIHCALFIWVFMVNSTLKVWLSVVLPSVLMTLIYLSLQG